VRLFFERFKPIQDGNGGLLNSIQDGDGGLFKPIGDGDGGLFKASRIVMEDCLNQSRMVIGDRGLFKLI
jgi:hypothetical protein